MRAAALLVGAATIAAACSSRSSTDPASTTPASLAAAGEWVVEEVVDGDTVRVRSRDGAADTVRLIGLNAPESGECLWAEASNRLMALAGGRSVHLVPDGVERDSYDRLLRFLEVDGSDVGELLLAEGLAMTRHDRHSRLEAYESAQRGAQQQRRGVWQPDSCGPAAEVEIRIAEARADAPGDDSQNLNGEWIRLINAGGVTADLTGWVVRDESSTHRYTFPDGFELPSGDTVTLHSGCGTDGGDALYWCASGSAIWNNAGDTALLLDPSGNVAAFAPL